MTSLDLMAARPALAGAGARAALKAECFHDWASAEARWSRLSDTGDAYAFQRTPWVRAWYRHCLGPGVEPLVMIVGDAATGADLLGLALVREREGFRRVVAFADRGLTDYNAPVLGRSCPTDLDGRLLWRALKAALPPADFLKLEKIPAAMADRPNPLASLPGLRPSKFSGHVLAVSGTWDERVRGYDRHYASQSKRRRARFDKMAGAAFRRCVPGPEAEWVFDGLRNLQRVRFSDQSHDYILDDEPAASFYDTVVRDGLRDGSVILTALTVGDEVVAALLFIADGRHCAMTRIAMGGPQWRNLAPGMMLMERTMEALHAEGYRSFDFTIGDYPYKRSLGAVPHPMLELRTALTPLGLPDVAEARLRAWARRPGAVQDWIRKQRGRAEDVKSA